MGSFRSGFVAVIGRPNVGKSTLLNGFIGQKVAIVSDKPQTTRNRIQAVLTKPHGQIVFLDTPGLHKPLHRLGDYMVKTARESLQDVDVVLMVVEMPLWKRADDYIIEELPKRTPVILAANKMDRADEGMQMTLLQTAEKKFPFSAVVRVSALTGENMETLLKAIMGYLPEGPKYYPDDWVTDHPEQFVITEFIREQVLKQTQEEIPHSVAVVIESMSQAKTRPLVKVDAVIFVERSSQKGILIGRGGARLKSIGTDARQQIEQLLGMQVHLSLWVKVKKDWRDKLGTLRELGYN